jgi:monoamine oxidase
LAAVNLGAAFVALGQMRKAVPLDAPLNAKTAAKCPRATVAQWLGPQRAVQGRA